VPIPKIHLDSNIYKFSATELLRALPRDVSVDWGGRRSTLTVYDPVTVNPNERIANNPELRSEAELLPQVAALAEAGLVVFQINVETQVEIGGLPDLDSRTGYFYGAAREIVQPPLRYGRALYEGAGSWDDGQYDFLRTLDHERFLELQKITGAYQGERPVNRNQLLDAFHLWCAEHSGADYFLSLDFKLAKVIERSKSKPTVVVVRPSQLLAAVLPSLA
jgi:hypothetical protein